MKLPEGLTQKVAKEVLRAKHNSPHIFFVGGVVGIIGAGVLACKATLKLDQKLDEVKNDLDKARTKSETSTTVTRQEDNRGELARVYVKSVVKVGGLYVPAGALAAASIAALAGSHVQMTRRNAALSSSLAIMTQAFRDYRERVKEEVGPERELDIYRNLTEVEAVVDGKKKMVKDTVNPNAHSPYARFFDESNLHWVKNRECNLMFLQHNMRWANDRLNARGYIMLNDVYEALGIPECPDGQFVGWVINGKGDGYVDFGMQEIAANRFGDPRMLLDFNVDGEVWMHIGGD